jgi:hypothetical protein
VSGNWIIGDRGIRESGNWVIGDNSTQLLPNSPKYRDCPISRLRNFPTRTSIELALSSLIGGWWAHRDGHPGTVARSRGWSSYTLCETVRSSIPWCKSRCIPASAASLLHIGGRATLLLAQILPVLSFVAPCSSRARCCCQGPRCHAGLSPRNATAECLLLCAFR